MIPKALNQITEQDLQSLVDNGVLEGKTIEYKQVLKLDTYEEKREFLADVSSFANASGGDLIYGIIEDRESGAPERLEGLQIENLDMEIRKLENLVRDGIQPRIPSVDVCHISLSDSKTAVVIRILKSWVSPHRVTYKGHDKFYSRNSKGKYPLDVGELRVAFNLSNSITEEIRKFRENRISEIQANETFVPLHHDNGKIILHLIPLSAVSFSQTYNMSKLPFNPLKIRPIRSAGWDGRYNLDGYLTYSMDKDDGKARTYVQLFRNGIFEAVESSMLKRERSKIPSVAFEEKIMGSFSHYFSFLKDLNVGLPIFAFLTLTGVKGYSMTSEPLGVREDTIEKDVLLIPEIVIESFDFEVEEILKLWFDTVWNACGFPCSLNFDNSGKWTGRT
ncbi:Divergent AAA domain protein [Methanosarcina siciliae HI350]|uniref:Divergent AAA domain protein n=1 Tax=Methanosarcina siciliae HI350 TaxID=1434119 RepID=A0A0E3PE17_9EURY|nr:ATP-binding protein [Methanosarcina siciliae]AKB32419.1 Divergent AAA domain protein [Methanosarcina siciliae HI350]